MVENDQTGNSCKLKERLGCSSIVIASHKKVLFISHINRIYYQKNKQLLHDKTKNRFVFTSAAPLQLNFIFGTGTSSHLISIAEGCMWSVEEVLVYFMSTLIYEKSSFFLRNVEVAHR